MVTKEHQYCVFQQRKIVKFLEEVQKSVFKLTQMMYVVVRCFCEVNVREVKSVFKLTQMMYVVVRCLCEVNVREVRSVPECGDELPGPLQLQIHFGFPGETEILDILFVYPHLGCNKQQGTQVVVSRLSVET